MMCGVDKICRDSKRAIHMAFRPQYRFAAVRPSEEDYPEINAHYSTEIEFKTNKPINVTNKV